MIDSIVAWSNTWKEKVRKQLKQFSAYSPKPVPQDMCLRCIDLCVVSDFTFEYIQREGLRDPLVFVKSDGLGIQYVFFLLLLFSCVLSVPAS